MRLVFLHGGPGFNSFAEEVMLGPLFTAEGHDIVFWNEPSSLRPEGEPFAADGAFERWLASAERFVLDSAASERVHVIAHSWTVHAALEIARRHTGCLSSMIIVAPGMDGVATYRNILQLAHDDLADVKPEIAAIIADCRRRARAVLDVPMREGLLCVLHDERLFTHYFVDADQFHATVAARARPEGQFDVDSFFAVLDDFGKRAASLLSTDCVTIPTLTLFGSADPVTPAEEQREAIHAAVPNGRIEVVEGCAHYLHLERPHDFVNTAIRWAASATS